MYDNHQTLEGASVLQLKLTFKISTQSDHPSLRYLAYRQTDLQTDRPIDQLPKWFFSTQRILKSLFVVQ